MDVYGATESLILAFSDPDPTNLKGAVPDPQYFIFGEEIDCKTQPLASQ